MYIKCFVGTIIFVITSALESKSFHFNRDPQLLLECIEKYDIFKDGQQHYNHFQMKKTIAQLVAEKFSKKIIDKEEIELGVMNIIDYLQREISLPSTVRVPWELLEISTIQAIMACSDEFVDDSKMSEVYDEANIESNFGPLPEFDNELEEVSNILDYVLVDWPTPLHEIIRTHDGRLLLNRYARNALIILINALDSVGNNHNYFRVVLRTLWMRRAQHYFDGRNSTQRSYFRHHYAENGTILAEGNINLFYKRRNQRFSDRNPPANQSHVEEFLYIHVKTRPSYVEYDIFNEYEQLGMTSTQYYIESHLDQFYRILLFFLVLRAKGISLNAENVVIPEEFQAILYSDKVYRNSLLTTRECLIRAMKKAEIEIRPSLLSARVIEEDLIYELVNNIRSNNAFTTTTNIPVEENTAVHNKNEARVSTVVIDCLDIVRDSGDNKNIIETNSLSNPRNVPNFVDETPELAEVLDYILVDWPTSLHEMIRSRDGRALLRAYAEESFIALINALRSVSSNNYFRIYLRIMWMHRAEHYFDGYNADLQYIPYRYTLDYPFPHTYLDINLFNNRSAQVFSDRNPTVPYLDRILNMYARNSPAYKRGPMTSSQYYFERHIDQFFRILFFQFELENCNIFEDNFNGTIPYDVVPEEFQALLYDDEVYRNYIWSGGPRHNEEDLLSTAGALVMDRIVGNAMVNIVSNGTTTTTVKTSSTTSKFEEEWRVRNDRVYVSGRDEHIGDQSEAPVIEKKERDQKNNGKNYGFIIFEGDPNQLLFPKKESLDFIKILNGLPASLG